MVFLAGALKVVFRAGALAPPWTALLADLFPVRSCLQVVKEMHKYAVRRLACPGGRPRAQGPLQSCTYA